MEHLVVSRLDSRFSSKISINKTDQDIRNKIISSKTEKDLIGYKPSIMPLGCEGDCQISRTEVVRTSGNRIPTGGPGTAGKRHNTEVTQDSILTIW